SHSCDHARGGIQRLPLLVAHFADRQQHTIPSEEISVMIITKMALPRRTFLRGMGAALALPVLDAMVPALTTVHALSTPVRRLGFVYIPMGSEIAQWMPKTEGRLTEF